MNDASAAAPHRRRLTVGYLSAAPRVSTLPTAELTGPRAHVLGVIGAFERLGLSVKRFIVGDSVPSAWRRPGSERRMSRNWVGLLAADIVRIGMGMVMARRAERELDEVDFVYERLAAFQNLGRRFQRRGIPWVLETNALLFRESTTERRGVALRSMARRAELRAYRSCHLIVCVTEALRDLVVTEAGVSRDKTIVLPNAVDAARFDPGRFPDRRSPGVEARAGRLIIGFVGGLAAWQALDVLISAIATVRGEGLDVVAEIVGDGSHRNVWESLARSLGVADAVTFKGNLPWDEIPRFLAGVDVGYSGQVVDTGGAMYKSPLKLYEYMAMGRPVIASAFADAEHLIGAGERGFLFAPGDSGALVQAIKYAIERGTALAAMGDAARWTVVDAHSWDSRVELLLETIGPALAARDSSNQRPV